MHAHRIHQGWADDWASAGLVALVLSLAVLVAAMAIAVYEDSALVAGRYSASELSTTGQGGR